MEIIHIILGKAHTNKMNGVNKVVNSLAIHQTELGHKVTVWGITKNPVHNYVDRVYSTCLFKRNHDFLIPKGMVDAINELEPGVVFHFHGGFIPVFFLISQELTKKGFEYLFTPHGSYNQVAMKRNFWKKRLFIFLFENKLVANAKSVHFIGESEIEGAQKLFSLSNFCLIPNGQETSSIFIPSINAEDNLVVGFCGRLDIQTKGLDLLFKGFAKYVENTAKTDAELWIIGDGPEAIVLKKLAQDLGIQTQVKFLGSIYDQEKMDVIKRLDFMMLTSRNEGLPGVVLEAASIGVPSIVSKETNMKSYVNTYNAGLVLEQNTPDFISESLNIANQIKAQSKMRQLKIGAYKMVVDAFNWKSIANRLVLEYA